MLSLAATYNEAAYTLTERTHAFICESSAAMLPKIHEMYVGNQIGADSRVSFACTEEISAFNAAKHHEFVDARLPVVVILIENADAVLQALKRLTVLHG